MNRVPFYAPIVDEPLALPSSALPGAEFVGQEKTPQEIQEEWVQKNVRWRVDDINDANLISSHVTGSENHAPVLDLDNVEKNPVGVCVFIGNWLRKRGFENQENDFVLIPSTNPGHFHLFIDVAIPWEPTYKELLVRLGDEGILEEGFVSVSLARGATFVRKPGHLKPASILDDDDEVPF